MQGIKQAIKGEQRLPADQPEPMDTIKARLRRFAYGFPGTPPGFGAKLPHDKLDMTVETAFCLGFYGLLRRSTGAKIFTTLQERTEINYASYQEGENFRMVIGLNLTGTSHQDCCMLMDVDS